MGARLRSPICIRWNTSGDSRLRPAPPSTRVLPTLLLQMVGVTTTERRPTLAVLEGWPLRSNMTGVLDHFRGREPLGAGYTTQTSLQRSLAFRQEGGAPAPLKMVATTYWGSWKPKPAPSGSGELRLSWSSRRRSPRSFRHSATRSLTRRHSVRSW